MSEPTAEQVILDRFREKCRMAGGLRAGFVLRRKAILYAQQEFPQLDLERGIDTLVEQKLLAPSESADFLFLTAAGVAHLEAAGAATR